MKKRNIYKLAAILILSIQNNISAQEIELIKTTHLANYPSASSIEFYNNRLYIIGDDAPQMVVLDTAQQVIDSISIFESKEKRIDKDEKADLEASVIIQEQNKNYLVAFSSFSDKNRNKTLVYELDPEGKKNKPNVLLSNLADINVQERNIEGAAFINNKLVLSNRANNTHKENSLIVTDITLPNGLEAKKHSVLKLLLPQTKAVTGISGMAYLKDKDMLLFTASTEDTENAHSDGDIGESYIGYVSNISQQLNNASIHADTLIALKKDVTKKTPQKIESLAVERVADKSVLLHLVADNDNGESTLFKMRMTFK